MNHRQRVLAALNHEEPDRVPIDLGGTLATSINIGAYEKLKVFHLAETEQFRALFIENMAFPS